MFVRSIGKTINLCQIAALAALSFTFTERPLNAAVFIVCKTGAQIDQEERDCNDVAASVYQRDGSALCDLSFSGSHIAFSWTTLTNSCLSDQGTEWGGIDENDWHGITNTF